MSETEQEEVDRSLIVSFEDQAPRYTYGFEAGMIWQQMQDGAAEIVGMMRIENRKTVLRMCEAMDYSWEVKDSPVEGWLNYILDKAPPEQKTKFRLIDGGVKRDT